MLFTMGDFLRLKGIMLGGLEGVREGPGVALEITGVGPNMRSFFGCEPSREEKIALLFWPFSEVSEEMQILATVRF